MFSLEDLFCSVDDFCQQFEPIWQKQLLSDGLAHRRRQRSLCLSQSMTKRNCFPSIGLSQFQSLLSRKGTSSVAQCLSWLGQLWTIRPCGYPVKSCPCVLTCVLALASVAALVFKGSTSLKVTRNRRIQQHKVFKNLAARGKTSVDWFSSFKLHLVVNDKGQLLNFTLTPGNTDDRQPVAKLLEQLLGKVFADKGYVSQKLAKQLLERLGVQLITKLPGNMKQRLMPLAERLLLRKRSIIETVIDQLKNISQIEHSRHRSVVNCLVNIVCGLIAYCHQPKKPSIAINHNLLPAA